MKPNEIRELTDEELFEKREELKRALFNLKVQFVTGQLDSPALLKNTRRDLARVNTIIRERGLEPTRRQKIAARKKAG